MKAIFRFAAAWILLIVLMSNHRATAGPPIQETLPDGSPEAQAATIRQLKQDVALLKKERDDLLLRVRRLERLMASRKFPRWNLPVSEETERAMLIVEPVEVFSPSRDSPPDRRGILHRLLDQ